MNPSVCIIGAGTSGIAVAKTLHQNSIAFDCFERGSGIGGNWRYGNDNGMSSAYRSLHINTNRMAMAYSDYPMPERYPMFPHHSQIIQYFDSYVDHFAFRDKITFQTEVTDVRKNDNGDGGQIYYVKTRSVSTGETDERRYTRLIVANGHHWNPRLPDPPFPGTLYGRNHTLARLQGPGTDSGQTTTGSGHGKLGGRYCLRSRPATYRPRHDFES